MLQLYYTAGSPPARSVLQTIRVLGLDVEVKKVDFTKQEHKTPEFLKINPMHQVPVLVDGDFIVTESRAIMTYLVNSRKPGSDLYPSDPKKRALVDQRLYFDAINFFELTAGILRPIFFDGATTIPADKLAKLKETLKIFESILEKDLYLAGDHVTLVDISVLSSFIMFQATFTNYGDLPNLNAWYKRCQSLPGFEENLNGSVVLMNMFASKNISPISLA